MQLGNVTTDPAKDYGITFARQQFNATLPPTVTVDNGDGTTSEVPNPDLFANDYDYAWARIGAMIASAIDSWAKQADEAAANPPPPDHGGVTADWRPRANADLDVTKKGVFSVLSTLVSVYQAKGETANVAEVVSVMEQVATIQFTPAVVAIGESPTGTRVEWDAAIKAAWDEIVAPTPLSVKLDFKKYGGAGL